MTIEQIKQSLPAVTVRMQDGSLREGQIAGRRLDFPAVYARVNGEWVLAGEWSWHAIAHCLNANKPLRA
jgi:hypothetical protein